MNILAIAASACCLVSTAVCLYLYRQAAEADRSASQFESWIAELAGEVHQPMLRLLSGRDLDLLRAHPATTAALLRQHRQQRYAIFQGYLTSLRADYRRAWQLLLFILLRSDLDGPVLLCKLIVHRLMFQTAVLEVRVRALFYRWGHAPVDARPILQWFADLQAELPRLHAAAIRRTSEPCSEPAHVIFL